MPRFQTLPKAQTSSARAAMQSFHCELCSKGYTRMNDYEAHLSSYDHTHRQRLKDMKQMVKTDTSRTRKSEAKADGLISIKIGADNAGSIPGGGGSGGGFKKGGFKKKGFAPIGGAPADAATTDPKNQDNDTGNGKTTSTLLPTPQKPKTTEESDTEDEGYQIYDPRFPTD